MQQVPSPEEFSAPDTPPAGHDGELADLRLPPHSVEAEQSVLGGLMLDNHAWDRIADLLREDDFYRYEHRLIWRHISKLIELNRVADVVTVHSPWSMRDRPMRVVKFIILMRCRTIDRKSD